MNSEIKEIFKNTINPNPAIRSKSEERLAMLQKDYNLLVSFPSTLMKDSDLIVKKASSLFFKNAVISEWSKPEFEQTKNYIISNILDFCMRADEENLVSYNGILIHMYEKEKPEVTESFISNVTKMIKSNDMLQFTVALNVLEQIFNAEKIKYNLEEILKLIYNSCGQELLANLHNFINKNDFKTTKGIIKFISKSYSYYSMPDFLGRIDVFSYIVNVSTELLKIQNSTDFNFMKAKKWAAYFLYKACNKGIKKFYKNSDLSEFISETSRITYIYQVFISQLKMENIANKSDPILSNTLEFLTLCASDKDTYKIMEKDILYLITEYIVNLYELTEEEEDDFENDAEKYLRDKYHFFNYDLRHESGSLFCEIIKTFKHNEEGMNWLCQYFMQILESAKCNPNKETIKKSYAVYSLMANITHTLFKFSSVIFEKILNENVFYDLQYGSLILKSQACFFLSYIEEKVTITQKLLDAIQNVMKIVREKHPILSVDATLGMNFFVSNEQIKIYVKDYIGELIQSILTLSANYDIEPLTYILDNIVQSFTEEIAVFAPDLIKSMGNLIISHLSNEQTENDDKMMVVSGFLRSVETVINSDNYSTELHKALYMGFWNVLEIILREEKDAFYQEVLDIMNCFFYSIGSLDNSMCHLFNLVLNLPNRELTLYPNEIAELIDNVVCIENNIINNKVILDQIFHISHLYCTDEFEEMYDEDFMAGCKIVETLLLNAGDKIFSLYPERLDYIIKMVVETIPKFDEACSAIIYGMEVIMNCFYLRPLETFHILKIREYYEKFFATLCSRKKDFFRVHDKKICIRFLGRLFSLSQNEVKISFDVQGISKLFSTVFCSLPDAIEARNKLIAKEEKETRDSDEEYDSEASEEYNDLEEDIYFSTVLDQFDACSYIYSIFSSSEQDRVGSIVISSMSKEQLDAINDVFANKSKIQQKILN